MTERGVGELSFTCSEKLQVPGDWRAPVECDGVVPARQPKDEPRGTGFIPGGVSNHWHVKGGVPPWNGVVMKSVAPVPV